MRHHVVGVTARKKTKGKRRYITASSAEHGMYGPSIKEESSRI
jgi:hypothetical protein